MSDFRNLSGICHDRPVYASGSHPGGILGPVGFHYQHDELKTARNQSYRSRPRRILTRCASEGVNAFIRWLFGSVAAVETTGSRTLSFFNPSGTEFTYELVVLGQLNRSPQITTSPNIEALSRLGNETARCRAKSHASHVSLYVTVNCARTELAAHIRPKGGSTVNRQNIRIA